MNIPIVAVVDTNINPTPINYPIPGNDDAVKAIELYCKVMSEAINLGRAKQKDNKIREKSEKIKN